MQYVLVQDKQSVLLGPIFWRHRIIQSELEDLEVDYIVSPTEPNQYLKINDSLEIYPVSGLDIPSHNSTYEQLDGPYWQFNDGIAFGSYNIAPIQIDSIKNKLISLAANERYKKETSDISLSIQNTSITVATDRDSRNLYVQKLLTMGDNDTVQWKFPEGWLALSKQDLTSILSSVNQHVQEQFDWESTTIDQINSAQDVTSLQGITIIQPNTNLINNPNASQL
jgi:hypothetical protein